MSNEDLVSYQPEKFLQTSCYFSVLPESEVLVQSILSEMTGLGKDVYPLKKELLLLFGQEKEVVGKVLVWMKMYKLS